MKLVTLYSNKEKIFPTIKFLEGFNVVFAKVEDPNVREQDVHNLGKSFLIEVIDFCLLATIKKNDPFKAHANLFKGFIFYLELETDSGEYVTIRRAVTGRRVIGIQVETERGKILRDLPHSEWDHPSLGQRKAKEILNDLLGLEVIEPYPYRKGLGYFLRSQEDYTEEFRLTSKFRVGKHRDWKPFVALMLGFDHDLLMEKYDLDDQIKELTDYYQRLEKEAGTRSERYDEIKGRIQILENKRDELKEKIDNFSFKELEKEISEDVVLRIEQQIASLNQERYTIDYELQEIERSLRSEYAFDIEQINQVFQETEVLLPDSLIHDYQELVEFNRRLSSDRSQRLRKLRKKLYNQREETESRIDILDQERQTALATLQEMKTFEKYKDLQEYLYQYERQIHELEEQLTFLDRAADVQCSGWGL